ncbi:MAG: hypothetical protein H6799_01980 [Candidatus Nomurabacteria bacterium]|nr:MAG: hypothetical protein H6799_01980 [Candidatus Nomurabacteria bacterium]HRV75992.1 hypothetical protein [Candidatus Saccharimonadales bacterium]
MAYGFPPEQDIATVFSELYYGETWRARSVRVLVKTAMASYKSPYLNPREETGEKLILPHSIKYGIAIRYAEIEVNPEMEPNPLKDFSKLSFAFLSLLEDYQIETKDELDLYGAAEWVEGVIPMGMQLGYGEVVMVRQSPVPNSRPLGD